MDELVEFVQNVPKPRASQSKEVDGENIYKMLESSLNFPIKLGKNSFNRNLREIYSKKSISDALLKIRVVGFNENIVRKMLLFSIICHVSLIDYQNHYNFLLIRMFLEKLWLLQ